VIDSGQGFRQDHAAYFLHSICVKRWLHDVDDNGFAILNTGILRWWIQPRAWSALKRCFLDNGVLLTAPHSAGHHATGYRVAKEFDGPPRRYVVQNLPLARKLLDWRQRYRIAGNSSAALEEIIRHRQLLLDHQWKSLFSLSLPNSPAAMVDALRDVADIDLDHIAYVAQCIQDRDYEGLTVDAFGWRLHSLITRTSSHLRPLLLLDGRPVAEVDITNSQPLLLAILMDAQHMKCLHNIVEGRPGTLLLPLSVSVSVQEIGAFRHVCETGEFYDLLAGIAGIPREHAKIEVFRDVLFGKAHFRGRTTEAFASRWPAILACVRKMKKERGHKTLAQALQRAESIIMLDGAGSRLLRELPGVPFLTVHDSVLTTAEAAEAVKAIMLQTFKEYGVQPKIKVKS
jgi:hypothetical protein